VTHVYPHDPVLPGVAEAVDVAVVARRLRRALASRHLRWEPTGLRVVGLRYEPETYATLEYRLGIHDRRRAVDRSHLLSGTISANGDEPGVHKAGGRRAAALVLGFDPVLEIAPDLALRVFPYDPCIPALAPLLLDPAAFAQEVGLEDAGWRAQVVQYRAERGAVVELRAPSRRYFVKLYSQAAPAPRQHEELGRQVGFDVGVAVATSRDGRAVVMQPAEGSSLSALLARAEGSHAAHSAGAAIAFLHTSGITTDRVVDAAADVRRLHEAAETVSWAAPDERVRVEAIVHEVGARLGSETRLAPTHRDLKPDHIFFDGGRVTFTDLDSFALADPTADLASVLTRIEAMTLRGRAPAAAAEAAAAALSAAYRDHAAAPEPERLAAHQAFSFVELGASSFRRQDPRWRRRLPAFVARASAALRLCNARRAAV
jgi:hypothetical protein